MLHVRISEEIRYETKSICESVDMRGWLSTQVVQVCAEHKKPRKLLKHLEAARAAGRAQRNQPRCLVFTNRVKTAKFVAKTLAEAGHRVGLLHGQRPQNEREVRPSGLSLVHRIDHQLHA